MGRKKKIPPAGLHPHVWEVVYEYEQRYCYCPGECRCDHNNTYVLAKCTYPGCDHVMDISDIQDALNASTTNTGSVGP